MRPFTARNPSDVRGAVSLTRRSLCPPGQPRSRPVGRVEKVGEGVGAKDTDLLSEEELKQRRVEELKAAEKFMVIGSGEAECQQCKFMYRPAEGDPQYPVAKGTLFSDLPEDWQCPVCGAPKGAFESKVVEVAGFAQNQQYGFGTNSMTQGQKNLLIWGSMAAFFSLFLAGYLL